MSKGFDPEKVKAMGAEARKPRGFSARQVESIAQRVIKSTLESMGMEETAPGVFKPVNALLNSEEVQEMLKLTRQTLWELRRAGKLVWIKVGGAVRYRREDVEAFLQEQIIERERKEAAKLGKVKEYKEKKIPEIPDVKEVEE